MASKTAQAELAASAAQKVNAAVLLLLEHQAGDRYSALSGRGLERVAIGRDTPETISILTKLIVRKQIQGRVERDLEER